MEKYILGDTHGTLIEFADQRTVFSGIRPRGTLQHGHAIHKTCLVSESGEQYISISNYIYV